MAITTINQVVFGMKPPVYFAKAVSGTLVAGRPHSYFYQGGYPAAAGAPSPGVAGAALNTYTNQIPFNSAPSGQNTYLAKFSASAAQYGKLLLCDRLWHNSGLNVTITTAQNVNSVAWAPRDLTGGTGGMGVMIGMEVVTAGGAGTPTLSMSYTNHLGVAGRTGAGLRTVVASSIVGSFYPMGLQSGDTGIQSIQTWTHNATMTSGSIALVAYRIIASLDMGTFSGGQYTSSALDAISLGLPRLYDSSVPFLIFIPNTTTTTPLAGEIVYTQG